MRIRPGMDGIPQSARTAIWGMLFCSFIAALPVHAEPACPQPAFDETTSVRSIHDGDTLTLKDGRKVRLIGINTPELSRDNKPAEPFAVAAREALKSLLSNSSTISLVYGKDKADRYGRLLAHIYTAEGENVQQDLLSQGMASAIVIPPNTTYAACYLAAEKTARCQHRGIWNDKTIVQAKELNKGHTGFHMIRGQVRSIDDNAKGIWLNLDDRLTVGIRPANQALFDKR
jgi:endonuclease YncB( thermonuclease family)